MRDYWWVVTSSRLERLEKGRIRKTRQIYIKKNRQVGKYPYLLFSGYIKKNDP